MPARLLAREPQPLVPRWPPQPELPPTVQGLPIRVVVERRTPDISAARRELGWVPRTPLAEGLRRTISYAEKELTDKVYTELTWAEMN